MRTNWLNTSRLLIVVVIMMFLAGCAKTWVTADGRIIEMNSKNSDSQEYCDKNIDYSNIYTSAVMCRRFGNYLKDIDPVNSIKYLIKAFDKGLVDVSYIITENVYKYAKDGILSKDVWNEYGQYSLDLCLTKDLNGTKNDWTPIVCSDVAKLYELDPPNIQKAKSAYKRNCDHSGDCDDYERLGGSVDWNLAKRQQAYSERRDAQLKSDHKRVVEDNNRERRESNRQSAEEKRQWNETINSGLQSMQNSLNQGAAAMNYANQVNADVDAQLRRQKEDRAREARELQRQQNENAANQQRQAEENRRQQQQVALERSQRDEQDRQQRQRDEQQSVAQQEVEKHRQQQKKQLSCTNMTPAVSGTIKRLKGAGHCDGELAAYLTNNSGIKVMCDQKFERNGVLPGSGAGAQVHIQPGETVGGESGGLWECGHADSDSYKYYCIPADEPYECMRKF